MVLNPPPFLRLSVSPQKETVAPAGNYAPVPINKGKDGKAVVYLLSVTLSHNKRERTHILPPITMNCMDIKLYKRRKTVKKMQE